MYYDNEYLSKLKEALNLIKHECMRHEESCEQCPMYSMIEGKCLVTKENPDIWTVEEPALIRRVMM